MLIYFLCFALKLCYSLSPDSFGCLIVQEPVKSRAPQLHLEYRFYKTLGTTGEVKDMFSTPSGVSMWLHDDDLIVLEDGPLRLHHFHNKWLLNSDYILILSWISGLSSGCDGQKCMNTRVHMYWTLRSLGNILTGGTII